MHPIFSRFGQRSTSTNSNSLPSPNMSSSTSSPSFLEKSESSTILSASKEPLLPSSSSPSTQRKRSNLITLPRLLALSSLAVFLLFSHLPSFTSSDPTISLAGIQGGPGCVQPSKTPIEDSELGRSDVFFSEEYKSMQLERFLGAIRLPTETFDDMRNSPVDGPDFDERWTPFIAWHEYLVQQFPLVHAKMKLEKPNRFGLIFTLEGTTPGLKPLVLTGHQDVVPARTSLDRWSYPPFAGTFKDGIVWGRGSVDCKNSVIAILSGMEHLLSNDWESKRTIIFAFGFDEEIGGPQGASSIAPLLAERYGKHGVALLIDEGGNAVSKEYGKTFVLPGIGEKGGVSPTISVETAGGHSSTPTPFTSIGVLARIVGAIEDANLFPPTLSPSSPIFGYLQCVAEHGKPSLVPEWISNGLKGKLTQKSLDSLAASYAAASGRFVGEFLVRTSKAVTLFSGGHKVNALPESALATFNSRIDFSQTPESVLSIYTAPILPFAAKFNLTLVAHNSSVLYTPEGTSAGTIKVSTSGNSLPLEVAPQTPFGKGKAWEVFGWAARRAFASGEGDEMVLAPSAMTGNTDTAHYWNLSRSIYRFAPKRLGAFANTHTVDEWLRFDTHIEGIVFFHELMLLFSEIEGNDDF